MIGNNYKAQRDNTIDIANNYLAKTDENDGVDKSFLQQRVDALKNGKFLLSVAGEVKAGKSTFINTLLGKEILPSDVLQATSAIVEIFKSDTSFLKVVYADDTIEELYDDLSTKDIDEAKERLSQICRIEDQYRNIPHTLINDFIISNDKLDITDELIENLEDVSGMNLQNEKQLIESYIAETPKSKIPVEINFGYPLNWNFEELRIVDSPGVNATGGVQDVSLKFLEKANAILFVHPIKPIESESFKNFVNKTISNKSSENLFLILTHKGLYEEEEVQRLLNEARRLYGSVIAEDRIIAVDSVLEQINNELKNQVPLKVIRENKVKKKILSSYREQAEDEERELIDVINEAANFQQIYTTIDEYSMKVPQLQLKEILETIKAGYTEQDKLVSEKINRLNLKKKSPQSFAREIERITEVLETFKLKINEINMEANDVFGGNSNSEVVKNINSIVTNYLNKINAQQDDKTLKKLAIDFQNEVSTEVDKFSKNITSYFFEKLKELDISFKGTHNVTIPKIDLKAIENSAKNDSYELEYIYEKKDLNLLEKIKKIFRFDVEDRTEVGKRKKLNTEKYLNNVKQQITSFLQETKLDTITQTKNIVKDYLNNVASRVNKAINERQRELDIEKQKNLSNKKILETLDGLKKKHQTYPSIIKKIDEIIEEVML